MDNKTREFLEKLADLMDEYSVTGEVIEKDCGYCSFVDGVELEINISYGETEWIKLPENFDGRDIRKVIGENEPPELIPGTKEALDKLSIRKDSKTRNMPWCIECGASNSHECECERESDGV